MKKALIILAVAFVAFCGLGSCALVLGTAVGEADKEPGTVVDKSTPPPTVEAPTPTTPPAEAKTPKADTIKDGMYVVGRDLAAGQYKSPGAVDKKYSFCSVFITEANGETGDTSTAELPDQPVIFTATDGQLITISGCQPFAKVG